MLSSPRLPFSLGAGGLFALAALAFAACNAAAPDPFGAGGAGSTSAGRGGASASGATGAQSGSGTGPILGGPCVDDAQCHDGIACTLDRCDPKLGRCRFEPDDTPCQNGVYCDGIERCDPVLGCVPGEPIGCEDETPCTVDACDEASHSCLHLPRDADGDGDPDGHCPGGHDCDDSNPNVSSLHVEVCGNGIDDNCDGKVDETPCEKPQHDTCADPLVITASGSYAMTTLGSTFDYPTSCDVSPSPTAADVVAAIEPPGTGALDVFVRATTTYAKVAVALAGQCGDPSSEIACGPTFASAHGGSVAKLRAHAVDPTAAPAFPLYVTTDGQSDVTVAVTFGPPTPKPSNETCGTAKTIVPGIPEIVELLDAATDVGSACPALTGDLVYTFTLAAPADVDVFATSNDGDGVPVISLRDAGCALPSDEIACSAAATAHVFRRALDAGTYAVSVAASAPTDVTLTVETSAPTAPPADDGCAIAPALAPNTTIAVDLAKHQDDGTFCLGGAPDAAYDLTLGAPSDVLLVERIGLGDSGAMTLTTPACDWATALVCGYGTTSPVRVARHNVPAGDYRVIVESVAGGGVEATAFVRPAVPPTLVPFSDGCADATLVPETGGFFQGNTANATADFSAGCDTAGVAANGAPDQLLKLVLTKTQRVVLDMTGSVFDTLLDVRKGPSCPGTEVPIGCAIGSGAQKSYLDLTLDAGTYYLQIDGYDLAAGEWFLDVRVVDP